MMELKGNSGAVVSIRHGRYGSTYVRKAAADVLRNDRLREQCRKQRISHGMGLKCPQVYDEGFDGGLYYFDMEYISGVSLFTHILNGQSICSDIRACLSNIDSLCREGETGCYTRADFVGKIKTICESIAPKLATGEHSALLEAMGHLEAFEWPDIAQSECHGDFTLENIIVSTRGVYLIDFDSVEFSSIVADYTKLFQDTRGHWCLRNRKFRQVELSNFYTKLHQIDRIAGDYLSDRFDFSAKTNDYFAAFHLLRTLPYAKDDESFAYAAASICNLLGVRPAHESP